MDVMGGDYLPRKIMIVKEFSVILEVVFKENSLKLL